MLKVIKVYVLGVKCFIIMFLFVLIMDEDKIDDFYYVFMEKLWNLVIMDDFYKFCLMVYCFFKKYVEKVVWDFVEKEKLNFDVVIICLFFVFGFVVYYFVILDSINIFNECIVGLV